MKICRIVILSFAILFLITSLIGRSVCLNECESGVSEGWQGESETEFRRISVYFAPHSPRTVTELRTAKGGMEKRIAEQDEEIDFLVAWGGEGESEFATDNRQEWMKTFLVNQDFFAVRAFPMTAGAVYPLGEDWVVLNEYAAWKLFGSVDCVGLDVAWDGVAMVVAAVVNDGQENAVVYAPANDQTPITFFETVLPEFVNGYAKECVAMYFMEDDTTIIRENDTRFDAKNLRALLRASLDDEEQTILFRVPWWEFAEWHLERELIAWHLAVRVSLLLTIVLVCPYLVFGISWIAGWVKKWVEDHRMKKKRYDI